jgi:LAS superfamily LD-carboxypeptidase LdcB
VIRASLAKLAVRTLPEADHEAHAYASCGDAPEAFVRAADENARSLEDLDWAPFGQPEKGWQVYDLLVGREIDSVCGSGTPVFAEKLAAFQAKYQLPADGVFNPATFEVVKGLLQERRPFVMARLAKICPDAPAEAELVPVPKEAETFEREDRMIRADVFAAYQRMVAAARAELPSLKDDPKALTIFSAYRSPESDALRCGEQGNCDGLRRAACSSHRTGTAIDMNVGWVSGVAADSTSPENRLLQTRTAPYRWLVMNAARFGFVNYPYEPWHWEWIGSPDKPALGPIPPPVLAPADTATAASPTSVAAPATPPEPQGQVPHSHMQ